MRVLLVQPPLLPNGEVRPPLGLCTLASWLLAQGHQVHIQDLDLETKGVADPSSQYLELFGRAFLDFSPDAVGVTSMYSNSLQAERVLRTAKRLDSSVMTMAGGSHFGAAPVTSLARVPELDFAIEGEGETALVSLLAGQPPASVPRLHYRERGQVHSNAAGPLMNLADLPAMWSTLGQSLELSRYRATTPPDSRRKIIYVEAGRGCPFACSFCATAPFWQQKYRVKPVSKIVEEIRFLHEELGYDSFILVHDLLTVNPKFISEFCDAMIESRLPVEWMANSRTDLRLHGILPKMKAAGCWKLFFGVESASPRVQEEIDKHLVKEDTLNTIRDLTAHGIGATTSFVMGFASETPEDLSDSIRLGARLKLMGVETVQFHRLRLFPPSKLSRGGLTGDFDEHSLRIEYPFLQVTAEDLNAIREAPEFFAGYWPPASPAGSAEQLAQVEMFFHHMVALAPMTVAAAAHFLEGRLIPAFYEALARNQGSDREQLDWETGDLYQNWRALGSLLEALTMSVADEGWQARLLRAVRLYEQHRVEFVHQRSAPGALISGENWAAFESEADVREILARLVDERVLTPDLLADTIVVLVREQPRGFAAYLVDPSRRRDLLNRVPELMELFEHSSTRG